MNKIILAILFFNGIRVYSQEVFPYKLNHSDFYLAPLSLTSAIGGNILSSKKDHNLTLTQIQSLDRKSINRFDRGATENWSIAAQHFSNYPKRILMYSPALLALPQLKNRKWKNLATLTVMYLEVRFLNGGLTAITKSLVGRTRPYLYNDSFTPQQRFDMQGTGAGASTSFFSGHSSTSFSMAVFLSKTLTDIYGKKIWTKAVWVTSLTLASATAYARVRAGVHYPTDVIAGAVVGSAVGYFVPVLHKIKPEKISITMMPTYFSFTFKL